MILILIFSLFIVLAYTYDTRTAPLFTRLFVSAQNPEPAPLPCFYACMTMIIEKGKIRERPHVHFPCRCITKFRVGEQPNSITEWLSSGHVYRPLAVPKP